MHLIGVTAAAAAAILSFFLLIHQIQVIRSITINLTNFATRALVCQSNFQAGNKKSSSPIEHLI
jgi:hypothetical protein